MKISQITFIIFILLAVVASGFYLVNAVTLGGNLSMGGYKITNLGAPLADSDMTTKGYVDSGYDNVCLDGDGDDYGNPGNPICPNGSETDCNDDNAAIYPGATEVCDDTVDNDCDGNIDCLDSECDGDPSCYCADGDGDGYGVCPDCDRINGCTYDGNDCCDSDSGSHPGAGYHTSINNCASWDWNCDGSTSKSGDDCNMQSVTLSSPNSCYINSSCTGSQYTRYAGCTENYLGQASCGQTHDYDYCWQMTCYGFNVDRECVAGTPTVYIEGDTDKTCSCK